MVTPKQLEEVVQAYISEITTHQHVKDHTCTCPDSTTSSFIRASDGMLTMLMSLLMEMHITKNLTQTIQSALTVGFIIGSRCEALEHLESLMKESQS